VGRGYRQEQRVGRATRESNINTTVFCNLSPKYMKSSSIENKIGFRWGLELINYTAKCDLPSP
jgi:hypothetical protein